MSEEAFARPTSISEWGGGGSLIVAPEGSPELVKASWTVSGVLPNHCCPATIDKKKKMSANL